MYKILKNISRLSNIISVASVQQRNINSSKLLFCTKNLEEIKPVKYIVSKDPEEWKYVKQLVPVKYIPEVKFKESYPSGWTPQNDKSFSYPYYVRRSRNHMQPIYLKISCRGMRRITVVRHIEGNIWLFERELRKYLEETCNRALGSKVDEVGGKVSFRGDYVFHIKNWFNKKGL